MSWPNNGASSPGAGALVFATPALLAAFDASALPSGSVASVGVVNDGYRLILAPSPALVGAADGVNVVTAAAPAGAVWVRLYLANEAAWFETAWYVDAAGGNDANTGTAVGAPLRTLREVSYRLRRARLQSNVTVEVAAGVYEGFALQVDVGTGFALTVHGAVSASAPAVLTAVTATNPAAGGGGTRGAIAAGVTAFADKARLRLVSGAGSGAIAYVTSIAGGATAPKVSRWCLFAAPQTGNVATYPEPAIGDSVVVDSLNTEVGVVTLEVIGGGRILIQDVVLRTPAGTTSGQSHRCVGGSQFGVAVFGCVFFGCSFSDSGSSSSTFIESEVVRVACVVSVQSGFDGGIYSDKGCVFNADSLQLVVSDSAVWNFQNCCLDGVGLTLQDGGRASSAGDLQAVDRTGAGVFTVETTASLSMHGGDRIWGPNTAGSFTNGFVVRSGAWITYSTKPTMTGATNDAFIGGVAKTYAQIPFTDAAHDCGFVAYA